MDCRNLLHRTVLSGATIRTWPVPTKPPRSVPDDRVDRGDHEHRGVSRALLVECRLSEVERTRRFDDNASENHRAAMSLISASRQPSRYN